MKPLRLPPLWLFAPLLALSLFTGCASVERTLNNLPQVSAQEIHIAQSNPISSIQLDAVNLVQTAERATADTLTVQVSAPFLGTTSVTFKNYVRDKRGPVIDAAPAE